MSNAINVLADKGCEHTLDTFRPTTEKEIVDIIKSSKPASSEIDPIPTTLLKECCTEVAPIIPKIVNLSLVNAYVPHSMKKAVIRPLIKKVTLDPETFKNYRPVSNLSFISKILEKVIARGLNEYLADNNLHTKMQSAYKGFHSTETALLRVHNDLTRALDNKQMAILVLLDLSAAFDTIEHDTLLKRLRTRFGISGKALDWIESYIKGRTQYVSIGGINRIWFPW